MDDLHKYLSTTVGRDKIGKLVHYSARGLAGYYDGMAASAPIYAERRDLMRSLFRRLMEARRTNRILMELGIIITLRDVFLRKSKKCPWGSDELSAYSFGAAQGFMLYWYVSDHYRWLQEIGWIPGDPKLTKIYSFYGFVAASLISVGHFARKMSNEEEDKTYSNVRNLTKHAVTLAATMHIAELADIGETACGACGTLAAGIDVYEGYP